MKSLSLYYYTFVDLLDFKDHVNELLTTIDACQISLDITVNFHVTSLYLELVTIYIQLMILLSRVDDRKAVLGLFNAAYEMSQVLRVLLFCYCYDFNFFSLRTKPTPRSPDWAR